VDRSGDKLHVDEHTQYWGLDALAAGLEDAVGTPDFGPIAEP
jgi:hypothetical protein